MYMLLSRILRTLSEAGMAIGGLLLHINGVSQGEDFLADCKRVSHDITELIHRVERERDNC